MIFKVVVDSPLYQSFDYLPPVDTVCDNLKPGTRLVVPFGIGNHKKIAFLIEIAETSDWAIEKLKRVERILDNQSLLSALDLSLLHWVSRYYHHPLGEVVSMAFPGELRRGKAAMISAEKIYILTESGTNTDSENLRRSPKQKALLEKFQQHGTGLSEQQLSAWDNHWRTAVKALIAKQLLQLDINNAPPKQTPVIVKNNPLSGNSAQQAAIDAVCASLGKFAVFLLEGVTGSGKTEVYLQIIHTVLQRGQQVLVLVPEISLTPQLEARFKHRFAVDIAVSHSRLTDHQRQTAWLHAQRGTCGILLGTRSVLFTPFHHLGLIVLDEEHDSSFKQQEGLRFSARDTAIVRAKMLNIPVLLGSATPSLETLHNVAKQRYQWLHLPERAGSAIAPVLQLLDIRNKKMREGLSENLLAEIHKTLAKNEQVLLFLNRRGYAPTLICHGCGWVARCQHCAANLVIHQTIALLRCHHCGTEHRLPEFCPDCQTGELTPLGLGTERVEKVLHKCFTDKTILRLDKDSTQRKGSLEAALEQIHQGKVDIILGTQLLAKGHHFPNVTLVAILNVDSGLFSIDFHATEKLAQLIVQVSGRAGRADKIGTVIMQTRQPDHPLLTTLITQGYQSFANSALVERQAAGLPPFSYQALFSAEARDEELAQTFLQTIRDVAVLNNKNVQLLGPVPAPMTKRASFYRYQLLLQSPRRRDLHTLLDTLMPEITKLKIVTKVRWSLDVDPADLY